MTIEEKRRELFEAWALSQGWTKSHTMRHELWLAFNAAIDAVEIEFPESCAWESLDSAMQFVFLTYEAGETGPDSVELCRRNDCIKAIESTGLGLKVKS